MIKQILKGYINVYNDNKVNIVGYLMSFKPFVASEAENYTRNWQSSPVGYLLDVRGACKTTVRGNFQHFR